MIRLGRALLAASALMASTGCASSAAHWIVETRNHQGDVALQHYNYQDASVAYQLALKIDAKNPHARAGLVSVQLRLASANFANSHFEDAIDELAIASKYSPEDDRIDALRSQIEQAEIKRDIVVSNFPSYKETGTSLRRAYDHVKVDSGLVANLLKRFNYTYDTSDLTKAIQQSYELNAEITRYTNRLILYRQLVESGVPETANKATTLAPPASLLPLP